LNAAVVMLAVAQGPQPQANKEASAGGNAKKRAKQEEEERNEDDASALEKERERLVYVLSSISLEDLVGALKGVNNSRIVRPTTMQLALSRIQYYFWPLTMRVPVLVPISNSRSQGRQ
jgi:hypothetical protein